MEKDRASIVRGPAAYQAEIDELRTLVRQLRDLVNDDRCRSYVHNLPECPFCTLGSPIHAMDCPARHV